MELVIKWDRLSWDIVETGLLFFFMIPYLIYKIIASPELYHMLQTSEFLLMLIHPGFFIPVLSFLAIYGGIFWCWWRRQTVARAWIVALAGQLAGPAEMLFMRMPGDGGYRHPGLEMGMLGVEIFYFALLIADIVQKKYFPDSKIARRIRKILAWPCLRT